MSMQGRSNAASGGEPERKSLWIPYAFFGAFLFVVAVNGVMIYFAVTTFSGVETENHYIKGIKYNAALEGQRAQTERGWKVGLDFVSPEPLKGRVSLNLRDKEGNLLREATATLRAVRPVTAGHDFDIELSYLGEGRLAAEPVFPLPGVWDLKLNVVHATGDYQEVKRIWVN